MATLITGGTSQIGLALAKLLKDAGHTAIFATRSPKTVPPGYDHVPFDRMDPSTFEAAFNSKTNLHTIESVYLLPPLGVLEPLEVMRPFIDLAVKQGVKRFVLLSSSTIAKGDPGSGRIHKYLDGLADIQYITLRPTVFIENMFNTHSRSIKERGEILSAVPRGRIPFVAIEDVAKVAFAFITGAPAFDGQHERIIIGPKSYTYDEIASLLTYIVGKPIVHRVVKPDEQVARYRKYKIPEDYAKWLVQQEVLMEEGSQEHLVNDERTNVGVRSLEEVLESNRAFWKVSDGITLEAR